MMLLYEHINAFEVIIMPQNSKEQRLEAILEILRQRNGASVKQLARELCVAEMTIRRDLDTLRVNRLVNLVHGAAIYNPQAEQAGTDYHVICQKGVRDGDKNRIGKAAAQLVEPGDAIFVDIGTTAVKMLSYLPNGFPVTVTCFTVNALLEALKRDVENLYFAGGVYHVSTQMFEGPESARMIQRMRASKAFVSAAGVSRELGLTCINQYEVTTKKSCLDSAAQRILLVDSSKFGLVKPACFGELSQIHTVITDSGISPQWRETLEEMGIRLILV